MIIWLDLETLGLEATSRVIEVAAIATNERCEYIGHPFHRVLTTSVDEWDGLDPVVLKMHQDSGLYRESLDAGDSEEHGWTDLASWIDVRAPKEADILKRPVMGGSGVHFERKVIDARHTGLPSRLHYRHIDVSTVRSMMWSADHPAGWVKQPSHRALHDVMDAISEYKHYLLTLGLFPKEEKAA